MPILSPIPMTLAPYHLLTYGTLLGTQLYQSFILTRLNFRTLPPPQFNALNKKVFPIYFRLQTSLIVLTALTHPPHSLRSLWQRGWSEYIPLGLTLCMAVLNLLIWGPETERVRAERGRQETRDGRKYNLIEGQSEAMKRINKQFKRAHAMVIHLNAIAMIATVWYGVMLSMRLV